MILQHFSLGNYILTSGFSGGYSLIAPQLKMTRAITADVAARSELTLDPYNGLQIKIIQPGGEILKTLIGNDTITIGQDIHIHGYDFLPTRERAILGQVYVDGETLKIRRS